MNDKRPLKCCSIVCMTQSILSFFLWLQLFPLNVLTVRYKSTGCWCLKNCLSFLSLVVYEKKTENKCDLQTEIIKINLAEAVSLRILNHGPDKPQGKGMRNLSGTKMLRYKIRWTTIAQSRLTWRRNKAILQSESEEFNIRRNWIYYLKTIQNYLS